MRHQAGFTLIELMIAVAIVGILAGLAMPVYTDYVNQARRSDGFEALRSASQRLEQCFSQYGTYEDTNNCRIADTLDSGNKISSPEGHYRVQKGTLSATAYTLEAVPQGEQANDPCGTLTLDNTGDRGADHSGCWQ